MTASEAKQCIDLNEQYEQTLSLSVSQNNNGKMKKHKIYYSSFKKHDIEFII